MHLADYNSHMDRNMKKILILGGTRFFGRALIGKLLETEGVPSDIVCFHRGFHQAGFPFPGVSHIIGDRYDESAVSALFEKTWDLVIDLSGTEWGMISTAVQSAQGRCGRYVFISSSSVYSTQGSLPHREDEPLLSGTGEAYALAKIRGEQLIKELFPHYTIIRPSKVYGPGNYYFSEQSFLQMLQNRRELVLKNDPILHFTYIDDLTRGIAALLETDGIFNVAGAEPAGLSRFIELIGELHGIRVQFRFGNTSDVLFSSLDDRILDLSAAKEAVGWAPVVSLHEGLMKTFGMPAEHIKGDE